MWVNTSKCCEGGIPIRDADQALKLSASYTGRDQSTTYKSIDSMTSFPIRPLATSQWIVVGIGCHVQGPSIVGEEDQQCVFPHLLLLQCRNEATNDEVHVVHHCCVCSPARLWDEAEVLLVLFRNLQRCMDNVKGMYEEKRLRHVMGLDRLKCSCLEEFLFVGCTVLAIGWLVCVPEIYVLVPAHILFTCCCHAYALCPIVIGMMEVSEECVIATAPWSVPLSGHTTIPLASHVRSVASLLHLLRYTGHIDGDPCITTYWVFGIVHQWFYILDVDMHWQSA
mmetsp:Transcript_48394/g.89122  ORF Transcript_48394/g.89122 Transcript_48394/m.89122 type:complete len:281 (+) Transcript_48394:575-1417(+)